MNRGEDYIPIANRYTLTILQACQYFGIGETKMRQIICENKDAGFVLYNGAKALIKRRKFEEFLDEAMNV